MAVFGSTTNQSFTFQVGANSGEAISVAVGDMTAKGLSLNSLQSSIAALATATTTSLATAQAVFTSNFGTGVLQGLDNAIKAVSDQRAQLGAAQNGLTHTVNSLEATTTNLAAANSRIKDVDMAQEMTSYTSANILLQAATSMLSQANSMPQSVLTLLQNIG